MNNILKYIIRYIIYIIFIHKMMRPYFNKYVLDKFIPINGGTTYLNNKSNKKMYKLLQKYSKKNNIIKNKISQNF